jgi:hypothetical protein
MKGILKKLHEVLIVRAVPETMWRFFPPGVPVATPADGRNPLSAPFRAGHTAPVS